MGCDIHIHVERQRADGTWENLKPWRKCEWTDSGFSHYSGRSYRLFGHLANVREPGPDPRGLPPGLSPESQQMFVEWEDDLHSKTWYDAAELAADEVLQDIAEDFHELAVEALALGAGRPVRLIIAFDN